MSNDWFLQIQIIILKTLWFSKSGDYENFTTGTNADDAMIYTIASNQVNAIQYLKAVRTLIVGTSGGNLQFLLMEQMQV